MKAIFFNILLLLSLTILFTICSGGDIYYNHSSSEDNLIFVFTNFRHGARYPFVNVDYFGNGIPVKAGLTSYGAKQHLEIGKKYRERYSNFLDMNFNPKEMYIRTSNVERVVVSTSKQLEGLFGRVIERKYMHIINNGIFYWELYQLNQTERAEYDKYMGYCNNLNETKKRRLPDINEVFPILKDCFGAKSPPNAGDFCDQVFAAYFQYAYDNVTNNKIGKCGREKADQLYNFCVSLYDTYRGWDEQIAYMMYILFQNIFKYMTNAIEGKSPIKWFMIGGHDITVDKFMNFLDGLKIIPRTQYPHYAFNIIIELRKYSDEYYLEFYYNDILKYNETFQTLMDTLDNSKYSYLYNYCGLPPWKQEMIINTTQVTTAKINKILTTQNVEEKEEKINLNNDSITIEDITKKEKITTTTITKAHEIEGTLKSEKISNTNKIGETLKMENISTINLFEKTSKIENILTTNIIGQTTKKEGVLTTNKNENISNLERFSFTHLVEETIKIEKKPTTNIIKESTKNEEIPNINIIEGTEKIPSTNLVKEETIKNKIIPTTNLIEPTTRKREIQTTQIIEYTIKIKQITNSQLQKNEPDKIELAGSETINNEEKNVENEDIQNDLEQINRTTNESLTQDLLQTKTFNKVKQKLKQFFRIENDLNLYLILSSIIITIIAVIFFIILIKCLAKRRRKFIRLNEEQTKNDSNQQNNNINILSVENRK